MDFEKNTCLCGFVKWMLYAMVCDIMWDVCYMVVIFLHMATKKMMDVDVCMLCIDVYLIYVPYIAIF